ncbi:P1 family peptidase [Clostridioides difficile]|uniref:P1 family peptidase n=1 Tax=Clostridioides difficile TaxID=1496 RepID=UPI001C1C1D10|nr:P1 family peptidase [Clostridioides difficile]MDF3818160.1 P1 family peptidase [Clostridioides difficile]HBF4286631.1 P1 family peptidase [Clostridioides difficile]HBF5050014.1 P1 family peptidase [Clostridioides difficile]HBF5115827.1 P1 family peptidase [Clostridioides difficile]HBF5878262.1 P1 family peptidase [Clostridioides difficile]
MYNNILDIEGLKVGQVEDRNGLTGCTVVICEEGATCGVDVRGSAPGTRETDLLDPVNMVQKVHAVVLAGGSAYGLESTCGVSRYLEEKGIGFDVGVGKVPIVVGAVLFDLGVGSFKCRPDLKMGYRACEVTNTDILNQGNYGAGCGATVGKIRGQEYAMKGGIGSYSIKLDNGLVVSALIAVNALGDVYENGKVIAGALNDKKTETIDTYKLMKQGESKGGFSVDNTTIGIIATNAKLTKAGCKKISQMGHDGYAKAIFPIHTPHDGDTIFTISTGEIEADITLVGSLAVEVVEKSIINAVKKADSVENIMAYKDIIKKREI